MSGKATRRSRRASTKASTASAGASRRGVTQPRGQSKQNGESVFNSRGHCPSDSPSSSEDSLTGNLYDQSDSDMGWNGDGANQLFAPSTSRVGDLSRNTGTLPFNSHSKKRKRSSKGKATKGLGLKGGSKRDSRQVSPSGSGSGSDTGSVSDSFTSTTLSDSSDDDGTVVTRNPLCPTQKVRRKKKHCPRPML